MASVNKIIIVGNLTRDAEIRIVGQNNVASFSVATSEEYTNQNGQQVKNTEYHRCELWGKDGVHQYLLKGTSVYVEGSIRTESWKDKEGVDRQTTKIRVFSLQLLGSKSQQQQQIPLPQPQAYPYQYAQQPLPQPMQYQQPTPQQQYVQGGAQPQPLQNPFNAAFAQQPLPQQPKYPQVEQSSPYPSGLVASGGTGLQQDNAADDLPFN